MVKGRIFFLIAILSSWSAFAAPWTTFRGNQERTGFYPEKVGVPDPEKGYIWKVRLGGSIVSSPSIKEGKLYVGCRDSSLYIIDIRTGEIIHKVKTNGWIDSSPLLYGNKVIVGSRDGNIYTINNKSGKIESKIPAGIQISSPAVYDNVAVLSGLGSPVNSIGSFHLESSAWQMVDTVWSYPISQMSYSSPALSKGSAVIGASNGLFYAMEASSGKLRWIAKTSGGVYLSTPAIDNNTVYFAPGNYDQSVYAYKLDSENPDGEPLWIADLGKKARILQKASKIKPIPVMMIHKLMRQNPKYRKKALAKLREKGYGFVSISAKKSASGKKMVDWHAEGDIKTSSVAVGPNNVYVIQKHLGRETKSGIYRPLFKLIALDKNDGSEVFEFSELSNDARLGYNSSPIIADRLGGGQVVYFGWGDGNVYALGVKKKGYETLWNAKLDGHIISSPSIADGNIYFATITGSLYAFKISEEINRNQIDKEVFAYPNPVKGHREEVYIRVPKLNQVADFEVVIYNTAERPVQYIPKQRFNSNEVSKITWNLSGIANGVYFAKIKVTYPETEERDNTVEKWIKIAVIRK